MKQIRRSFWARQPMPVPERIKLKKPDGTIICLESRKLILKNKKQ